MCRDVITRTIITRTKELFEILVLNFPKEKVAGETEVIGKKRKNSFQRENCLLSMREVTSVYSLLCVWNSELVNRLRFEG